MAGAGLGQREPVPVQDMESGHDRLDEYWPPLQVGQLQSTKNGRKFQLENTFMCNDNVHTWYREKCMHDIV